MGAHLLAYYCMIVLASYVYIYKPHVLCGQQVRLVRSNSLVGSGICPIKAGLLCKVSHSSVSLIPLQGSVGVLRFIDCGMH